MKRVLIALLLLCATVVPIRASNPNRLDLSSFTGWGAFDGTIEKQSWWLDCCHVDPTHHVENPLNCTWDINDHNEEVANGNVLTAGTTTSRADCHVFDFNPIYACKSGTCAWWSGASNWVGIKVTSPSSGLSVTMCLQPQGRCFTAPEVYDAFLSQYSYSACVQAVYTPDDPAVVAIVGSGGGSGSVTMITRAVGNPTSGTIRNIRASWGVASDVVTAPGCPNYPTSQWSIQSDYPFKWVQ